MPRPLRSAKLIATFALLFGVVWVKAYSTGPPAGFTSAPGEDTCEQCHDEFPINRENGSVSVSGLPSVYQLAERIAVMVSVQKSGQRRWGFQVTALTLDGAPAGQFVITDPSRTQIVEGLEGRFYVEHAEGGTYPGSPEGGNWSFDWVAPNTDVGPVTFYAAGNAANNDGERLGDYIYTTRHTVSPPSLPLVQLLSPNGGETVGTGEPVQIRWEASNNAAGFALLLVMEEGSIPSTIVSGLPASMRSFDWQVPLTLLSPSSRIVVVAFNEFGSTADQSDQPFSIVDRTPPRVQLLAPADGGTFISGTKLNVRWTASDNIGVSWQELMVTTDGGAHYMLLAGKLGPQVRSFDWAISPKLATSQARIRIVVHDAAGNTAAGMNATCFAVGRSFFDYAHAEAQRR